MNIINFANKSSPKNKRTQLLLRKQDCLFINTTYKAKAGNAMFTVLVLLCI